MKKKSIWALAAILFITLPVYAQQLGFTTGFTKQGMHAATYQPLYGMSFGKNFNTYFGLDAYVYYSQRTIGKVTQADYISFAVMPKAGWFGKRLGVYYSPGLLLNPTLHHANMENHTYLSAIQSAGVQIYITKKMLVDLKAGYDIGLTGAYFDNGSYHKYRGFIAISTLKFELH